MSWLFSYMIASLVGALFVVRFFEYVLGGVIGGVSASTAKLGLFVGTWTAITAASGLRGYSLRVRKLRNVMPKEMQKRR